MLMRLGEPVSRSPNALPAIARCIGREAIRSLHAELVCAPKPGLVSPSDAGAHSDMNAATFVRSLFALRHAFTMLAAAGAADAQLALLRRIGLAAEQRMLAATGGVNTHRGAIFTLGLLAAAAAHAHGCRAHAGVMGDIVRRRWGAALLEVPAGHRSHGLGVLGRYGASGARGQAASGFPAVFGIGWPALREAQARGASANVARIHALFRLIAQTGDTNLLHRAGPEGLAFARASAFGFLARGSVFRPHWQADARAIHRAFVARNLSPGGTADLLAASIFVERLARPFSGTTSAVPMRGACPA
jgi:triphosphoribosyl-dephospho-CoA synthase